MNNRSATRKAVVVGVDGSPGSDLALDWAVEEARLRNGHVVALSAWHYPYVSDALGQVWEYEGFEEDARLPDFYGPGDAKVIYVKQLDGGAAPPPH